MPGRPKAVASSSGEVSLEAKLRRTGLWDHFAPHVYSADHVTHAKPAPDLFLHAARTMGFRPDECIVIEDSKAGVEAAKRAGMRVCAFVGGSHAVACGLHDTLAQIGPDAIFDDMLRLPELVAEVSGVN